MPQPPAGELGAVIVLRLDRGLLGAPVVEVAGVSIHERLDTESAVGRFVLRTLASLAEMERDLIVERTREALRHQARAGEWVGRVPLGSRLEGGQLMPDPDGEAVIRRARRLRRQGLSLRAIAGRLGVPKSTLADTLQDGQHRCSARPAA